MTCWHMSQGFCSHDIDLGGLGYSSFIINKVKILYPREAEVKYQYQSMTQDLSDSSFEFD